MAAGSLEDDEDAGTPVSLMDFDGKTLIEVISDQTSTISNPRLVIALSQKAVLRWNLGDVISNLSVEGKIFPIQSETSGATCTALLVAAEMAPEEELLILNGDEHLSVNFGEVLKFFSQSGADAGIVCFDSIHPRYSYAKLDEDGWVMETAEKRTISRNATAGFYWFRRTDNFINAGSLQLLKGASLNGNYYLCPVMNEVILTGGSIIAKQVDESSYTPLKTSRQISKHYSSRSS